MGMNVTEGGDGTIPLGRFQTDTANSMRKNTLDKMPGGLAPFTEEDHPFGLLFFQIQDFLTYERIFGENVRDLILAAMTRTLNDCCREHLGPDRVCHFEKLDNGGFLILYMENNLQLGDIAELAMALRLKLKRKLNEDIHNLVGHFLEIRTGYSRLPSCLGAPDGRMLYNALNDAKGVAAGLMDLTQMRLMEEFRLILETPRLWAAYMPIVDLRSSRVMGWEALARGPQDSHFSTPNVLFDFAEEVGSLFSLEQVCRQVAIKGAGRLADGEKLFLNIHPHTVGDPNFTAGKTMSLLQKHGLTPEHIVFEVTERHPLRDCSLLFRTMDHYRSQGYQVAIDDVGAGYSGLWAIGQLRPDYIKIDMSLIRGVDANSINRALVETMVSFADKIGCSVIAEGIETETELSCLMDLGVHYGQGFWLGKPDPRRVAFERQLPLRSSGKSHVSSSWGRCSIPIRELVEPAVQVTPDEKIGKVQNLFQTEATGPIKAIVVSTREKPIGLVMSHDLNNHLATVYGMALYANRPITRLMDSSPLIFDGSIPVEIVAEKAMAREKYKVYDHILVTADGDLLGVVSVQKMLDSLARAQVEMAKGASPLTGLPGNVAIEREMEQRSSRQAPVSLIYVDLDNFKAYNDVYGFDAGDKMILLLAKVLSWAMKRHGADDDFIGHIGGDDFVIMTAPENAEQVCQGVVRVFQRTVAGLYSPEDQAKGFIEGKSRDGSNQCFPITSVSMAIIDCLGLYNLAQVAQRATEMKKFAKSLEGNVYVRDRRGPVGTECAVEE